MGSDGGGTVLRGGGALRAGMDIGNLEGII
jgi:hypothetical protein